MYRLAEEKMLSANTLYLAQNPIFPLLQKYTYSSIYTFDITTGYCCHIFELQKKRSFRDICIYEEIPVSFLHVYANVRSNVSICAVLAVLL